MDGIEQEMGGARAFGAPPPQAHVRRSWLSNFTDLGLKAESFLTGYVIIMLTSAFIAFLGVSQDVEKPEDDSLRLLWPPCYLTILILSGIRWRQLSRYWVAGLLSLILVGWAFASRYWSLDPDVTTRRSIALFFTTLFGLYLAAGYDGKRLPRLLATCFIFIAVCSLLTIVLLPTYGIHINGPLIGNWRGVFTTKNTFALMLAIGGAACVSTMIAERRISLIWGGGFALIFFLLIMSKGATSLISLVSALLLGGIFTIARRGALWKGIAIWVCVSVGALVTATVLTEKDFVLKLLGKDPTLTGRSEIWDAVFRQVEQSPLLGFGFAAFWQKDSAPAQWVRIQTGWPVPTAHNGWIDLIVQLGWIGAFLFAITYAAALLGAVTRFNKLKDGYLSLLILWIFSILSLSESVILQHNTLGWALFIAALARTTGPLDNTSEARDRLDRR